MAGEIEIIGGGGYDILGDDDDPLDYLMGEDDEDEYGLVLGDDDDDDDISDLMGMEDVMGGRRSRRRRAKARAANRALRKMQRSVKKQARRTNAIQAKAIQSSRMVQKKEPTRTRELVLGFDSVANVAAGATVDVTSRPQVVFRPDRIVVPATIAPNFLIVDVRVGKNSQFTAAQPVPAEVFSQGGFQVGMKMDTAQISQDIVMRVTNTSLAVLRFNAAMIGPALE